jgi:hypothetical protein
MAGALHGCESPASGDYRDPACAGAPACFQLPAELTTPRRARSRRVVKDPRFRASAGPLGEHLG